MKLLVARLIRLIADQGILMYMMLIPACLSGYFYAYAELGIWTFLAVFCTWLVLLILVFIAWRTVIVWQRVNRWSDRTLGRQGGR